MYWAVWRCGKHHPWKFGSVPQMQLEFDWEQHPNIGSYSVSPRQRMQPKGAAALWILEQVARCSTSGGISIGAYEIIVRAARTRYDLLPNYAPPKYLHDPETDQ